MGGKHSKDHQHSKRSHNEQMSEAVDKVKELFQQGNNLFRESKYEEAKSKFAQALETLKECDYHENKKQAELVALSNMGILEFAAGKYEQARQLLNEALDIRKDASGNIKSCNDLAALSIKLKRQRVYATRATATTS